MEIYENNKNKPANTAAQMVQLGVVVFVVLIAAFFVIKFMIWWILGILSIAVLAINYKLLLKLFGYLRGLYAKNVYMGVGATIGGFLAFTPFVGFLFLKTIWDFRKSGLLPSFGKKNAAAPAPNYNNNSLAADYMEVPKKDADSNLLP